MSFLESVSSENCCFLDPANPDRKFEFPNLQAPSSIHLTVVIPAYNEESRLPAMMKEAMSCLLSKEKNEGLTFETLIVDDGSTDKTAEVALGYVLQYGSQKVRLLSLKRNRGKGAAVKEGVLRARGKLVLFADADGATKFSDYECLESGLRSLLRDDLSHAAIAIGSRAHLEKESIVQRSPLRTFLMFGFHLLVWLFCVRSIRDTQCGFKLFTRKAALLLFPNLHVERWAFDVELLFLAERLGIPMKEIPVHWTEIEGSKLTPFWTSLQMGRDLMLIWLWYFLGVWNVYNVYAE